jgi:hypothetical protein
VPLSSRDAFDPNEPAATTKSAIHSSVKSKEAEENDSEETSESLVLNPATPEEAEGEAPATGKTKIEISHWEVSRKVLGELLAQAQKIGDNEDGSAYLIDQGAATLKVIQTSGRPIAAVQTSPLQDGGQVAIESPAAIKDSFHFSFSVQISKPGGHDYSVKWDSTMTLPEVPTVPTRPGYPAPVSSMIENSLSGSSNIGAQSLILILIEPLQRSVPEDTLAKAGVGPWSIFSADEFKSGEYEWVVVIRQE